MDHIFNLSYDLSAELADENHVKPEDRLSRETFMQILIQESIIAKNARLTITRNDRPVSSHIVINPVKTTLIFKSSKNREDIVAVLRRYKKQMHYVITEVKEKENDYLATLNQNEQEQASCDELVKGIIDAL